MRLRKSLPSAQPLRDVPCSLAICSRCGNQQRQRFGDQRRLFRSLDFHCVQGLHDHLSAFSRLDPGEHDAQPHAGTCRHRRQEADLVDPVIQPGGGIARDDADLHRQWRHHRQRQIAMSDRTSERTFPLRPFNVDVNPLAVAGAGCKRVDAWLIYLDPIGKSEFKPYSFAQTGKGEVAHVLLLHHSHLRSNSYMLPYRSRSSFLLILPTLVLGMLSTNRIFSGIPYFEMMPLSANTLRWFLMTASLRPFASDARLTTSPSGRSPHLSSLTPMTAASATPAHCEIRSSICSDETHSPPVLMTSLIRSVMWTYPPGLTTAISLVCR